jgi:transcriptional regulator of heat shock response
MPKKIIDDSITQRQTQILFSIVKEYCDTSNVVGSKELQEKYNFGFSSATIRNEVSTLRDKGYLSQPFTNSASKPTEKAFKVFVNQLLQGLQVTTSKHKDLEKQLFELQSKHANLSKDIAKLLAQSTGGLGFAVSSTDEGFSGTKSLIANTNPEDTKVSQILDFLDNLDSTKQALLDGPTDQNNKIQAYFSGDDNPIVPLGKGYAMVTTEITLEDGGRSVIGVITPSHLLGNKKNLEVFKTLTNILNKK